MAVVALALGGPAVAQEVSYGPVFTEFGPVADPDALEARLRAAADAHGILRVKGFVDVPGKVMRHVVQGVGRRIERYYDRPWGAGERRQSRLVVIGLSPLDRTAISAALGGI